MASRCINHVSNFGSPSGHVRTDSRSHVDFPSRTAALEPVIDYSTKHDIELTLVLNSDCPVDEIGSQCRKIAQGKEGVEKNVAEAGIEQSN